MPNRQKAVSHYHEKGFRAFPLLSFIFVSNPAWPKKKSTAEASRPRCLFFFRVPPGKKYMNRARGGGVGWRIFTYLGPALKYKQTTRDQDTRRTACIYEAPGQVTTRRITHSIDEFTV